MHKKNMASLVDYGSSSEEDEGVAVGEDQKRKRTFEEEAAEPSSQDRQHLPKKSAETPKLGGLFASLPPPTNGSSSFSGPLIQKPKETEPSVEVPKKLTVEAIRNRALNRQDGDGEDSFFSFTSAEPSASASLNTPLVSQPSLPINHKSMVIKEEEEGVSASAMYAYPSTSNEIYAVSNYTVSAGSQNVSGYTQSNLDLDEVLFNELCDIESKLTASQLHKLGRRAGEGPIQLVEYNPAEEMRREKALEEGMPSRGSVRHLCCILKGMNSHF